MPDEIVNYSALRLAWDIAQSVAVLGLFIWTVIDRKRQKNTDGIDEVKKEQQEIDRRVQKLEDNLEHLPTHHDLNAIKVQMASLTTQIQGMDHKLETIHQFLLSNNRHREGRS
ncbi:DUF2730 family protein [uncultured Endozoicomonas sp.]|uniref:DUF2730 family protein n=1 Tax=uncultured Endozoicomonas sp. TaxID=432652 RepID=UPI0026345C44|nr:DUF2730 family protein [uncultured Endozoicomonas sp.]